MTTPRTPIDFTPIAPESTYAPDRLIVKLNANMAVNFATDASIASIQDVNSTGAKILQLAPNVDVDTVMAKYQASGLFDYVEPDYIIKLDSVPTKLPDDPSLASEWALNNTGQPDSDGFAGVPDADIDAPEAWATQTGNPNFVIGVIDTGVDITHPDLVNNIYTNPGEIADNSVDDDNNGYIDDVHGWNFAANNNTPIDGNGHGTHVAGTIAAEGNNGIGVTGVAWNAKIMPLKFLSDAGSGYTSDAVLAINYATMMNVKITNNSWGGGGFSQALSDAISAANVKGDLFIAAAGNSGLNTDINVSYPAGYNLPNIISVAASDNWDWMAYFSNYGATTVDLAAPGYNIYSTFPVAGSAHGTNYGSISGTSMASPQVAGAAAVLWSQFPSLTAQQVKDSLMSTVDHPDYSNSAPWTNLGLPAAVPDAYNLAGKTVSGGRLNLNNALALNNNNSPVGTEDITGTATQNETLTATDSFTDADGLGVISHQWKADNANIVGATNNTLALTQVQVGKVISVVASYTDGKGALETVSSNITTVVANVNDLPTGSVNVIIPNSQTAPKVGDVLQIQTASVQDVDGLGTFNTQWKVTSNGNTTDIVGATANTYTVTTTDLDKAISTTVSYIDGFNTPEHVDSGLTGVVYAGNVGNATGAAKITGTVKQGSILTADISTIKDVNGYVTGVPLAQFSYQWYATDSATGSQPVAIQNAISKTYTLTQSQVGKKMSVVASFTDLGTPPTLENKTSSATVAVVNLNDLPTGSVTITGRIGVGETLTANNTLVDIDGMGTVSYQWKAAGVIISGATSNTYVIASTDYGKAITVEASYIDGSGTLEKVTSAAVAPLIVGTINNDSVLSGTAAADVIDALAGNDSVSGVAGNDYIYGREGNDTLNGGLGNDTLDGGLGNDTFYVDVAGDVIVEAVDEGIDTVSSSVSYSLTGTQLENLTLTGTIATLATGNDVANILVGNASANTLVGAAGSDTLDGGKGIDLMNGGVGNDTFYVDAAGDVIVEAVDEGIDTVSSSVSYSLAGTQLENLTLTGTTATLATGNDIANILVGNASANTLVGAAGSDTLDGGAGIDRMSGGIGDDTFYVNVAGDVIVEAVDEGIDTVSSSVSYSLVGTQLENLTLTGTTATLATGNNAANILMGNAAANLMAGGLGADILSGGAGNDTLDGGAGRDILSGGDGQDLFVLSNAYTIDSISDFISTDDKIQLKNALFESLSKGALSADMFKASDSSAASDANDYVIYNSTTGALYYDDDGSLSDAAPVQIAILASVPVLTASNFIIV